MKNHVRFAAPLIAFSFLSAIYPVALGAQDLSSPEGAVRLFVSAVAQNDLDGALAVYAIDESARGYDFTLMNKRIKALNSFSLAPSEYPLYLEINKHYQASLMASKIKFFIYSFLAAELANGKTIMINSDEESERYRQALDPGKIKNLKLIDIGTPLPILFSTPRNLENFRNIARTYGADEAVERVALYKLSGRYYYGGFQLFRYGKVWKVSTLSSIMANTSAMGDVEETTVEEFEKLISP